jgi:hypothetical protein
MQLKGRLSATTLGDVLGSLFRERATGTLELEELDGPAAGRRHLVHLEDGLVVQVDTALGRRLGEILCSRGAVRTETVLRAVTTSAKDEYVPLGQRLALRDHVDPTEIASALTGQVRDRLDALFTLRNAQLRFRVPRPRDRRLDPPRPLLPSEFLHGRPRAGRHIGTSPGGPESQVRLDPVRSRCLRVLGLRDCADAGEVRRTFRALAAHCHPDRHPEATATEKRQMLRRFAELSQAYHTLTA